MNILFLLKSLDIGGVEVVTSVLANKFAKEGNNVILWIFYQGNTYLESKLASNIKIVYGDGFNLSCNNIHSFASVINDCDIDIIINQWALPPKTTTLIHKIKRKSSVKVISVYHSDPSINGRLIRIDTSLSSAKNIERYYLRCKRALYEFVTSYSLRRCYNSSDRFVVLSDSYIQNFINYAKVKDDSKLVAISNPITIDYSFEKHDQFDKKKRLLYVGRIEKVNKKPQRVLDVWNSIMHEFSDWQLDIVGDGPDKLELESYAKALHINRCTFYGFQEPVEFYQKASIIMLTSDFEGFPLVLIEAMSFGVVPVVYGSFSAVSDIIEDGIDGMIVRRCFGGFDARMMVEKLKFLMNNPITLRDMSSAAKKKSGLYTIDKIYKDWLDLLKSI